MTANFISDLHLAPQRPGAISLFLRFLEERAGQAERLYILGDLFDAWIGDDYRADPIPRILDAMCRCADSVELFFMRGNRDFLIGEAFAQASGCSLLEDPACIDLGATPTLLMHGDLLCSDDLEYQVARAQLRNPEFIGQLLAKPIPERLALAAEYRQRSGEATSLKAADIMDVSQDTVCATMHQHRVSRLIHGHTHRPGWHSFQLDGLPAERIVLPEWSETTGGYLHYDGQSLRQQAFQ